MAGSLTSVNPEVAAGFERFLDDVEPAPSQEPAPEQESRQTQPPEEPHKEPTEEELAAAAEETEPGSEEGAEEESLETASEDEGDPIDSWSDLAEHLESDPEELLTHLKITGREGEEISLADAVNHYRSSAGSEEEVLQAQESYRSDLRKEMDGRMTEISQVTARLIRRLNTQQTPEGGWDKLRSENPGEYLRLQEVRNADEADARSALEAMEAEAKRVSDEGQRQDEARQKRETEKLYRLRPTWREEATAKAAYDEIQAYLTSTGFTPEEQQNLVDANSIITVWKAAQYDKQQATKPGVTKRLRKLPRKHLGASARDETAPAREAAKVRQAQLDKFHKSGRIEDAEMFFAEHVDLE